MNNYIDTHSHILYGIDDGAQNIEESISILKNLEKIGFKEVVLTPHYKNKYNVSNKEKRKKLKELTNRMKEENINIKLHLANELRICPDILSLIKNDEISLLQKDKLFLELPFTNKIVNLNKILCQLQNEGIEIVIVHPERYDYLTLDDYQNLIDHDVKYQINYESIIGTYGSKAKRRVKYLLKNDMVEYLGTDVHQSDAKLFDKFSKIENKIIKIVGLDKYQDLVANNIKKVMSNN